MNKFSILIILTGIILLSTCVKDNVIDYKNDYELVFRSGGALIFYGSSLTMDNRLVQDTVRRHTIFNKNKVSSVSLEETGNGVANVFGTLCRHYKVEIVFTDSTINQFEAYAKDDGESYTIDPDECIQVLKPSHPARVVEIERLSIQEKKYNLWLDQNRLLNQVRIKKDGVIVGNFLLDPLEYPQNQFSPKHIH